MRSLILTPLSLSLLQTHFTSSRSTVHTLSLLHFFPNSQISRSIFSPIASGNLNFTFLKMPIKGPDTPPPMIGKIGRYTVFITPPTTPKPSEQPPIHSSPAKVVPPPPVQAPPMQFDKNDSNSYGFFWNAVAKVQNAHSSLDDHLARWFGLNQSKYQWALDDYYESKGMEKEDAKTTKEVSSKVQTV